MSELLAGSETEHRQLVRRLERASKDHVMEISGDKMKLVMKNNNGMTTYGQITENTIEKVQSCKYLGEEGSKSEVLARIAQATTALSTLNIVWRDRSDVFSCDIDIPVCMRNLDTHRQSPTQNTSNGDKMLPKTPQHIVYKTCHI